MRGVSEVSRGRKSLASHYARNARIDPFGQAKMRGTGMTTSEERVNALLLLRVWDRSGSGPMTRWLLASHVR